MQLWALEFENVPGSQDVQLVIISPVLNLPGVQA
jgi:hypothetical protein